MIRFNDQPIRRKIIIIILSGMSSAIFVTFLYFFSFDRSAAKSSLQEELLTLSQITAKRSSAAVAFQDNRNAQQNLKTLALSKSIQSACIYSADGALFTHYNRDIHPRFNCKNYFSEYSTGFSKYALTVIEPIANKSQQLGHLVITSDLTPLSNRSIVWFQMSVAFFLLAFLVAYFMTSRMQRSIAEPISKLSKIMEKVKKDNDLSLRAEVLGNDELGDLVSTFNEMIEIIDYGNRDLTILYDDLVRKSAEAETVSAELEARNEQIKEMISGAAHDLRQPLQALNIFIDALGEQESEDKRQIVMNKIRKSVENLNELFDEILDVSKAGTQAQDNDLQIVSINELFSKLHVEFQAMARNKRLEFRIRTLNLGIYSVPGILERVVRNLLSNAINYTDRGGVLLGCRYHKDGLHIEVWDTGHGIPEKKQESIFRKFERLEHSSNRKNGYGLGLALVNQFIDMLGYDMTVNSKPNQGSCFRVFIPKKYLQEERHANHNLKITRIVSKPPNTMINQQLRKQNEPWLNILLIDDDDDVRESIKILLEGWQAEVRDFNSLETLAEYFASSSFTLPDFILSDYEIDEDTTGDMVIRASHEALGRPIPALIMTGNKSPAVKKAVLRSGFELIYKPVDPNALKSLIEKQISQSKA